MWNKSLDFNNKKPEISTTFRRSQDYNKNFEYSKAYINSIETHPHGNVRAYIGSSSHQKDDVLWIKYSIFKNDFSIPISLNQSHIGFKNAVSVTAQSCSNKINNSKPNGGDNE